MPDLSSGMFQGILGGMAQAYHEQNLNAMNQEVARRQNYITFWHDMATNAPSAQQRDLAYQNMLGIAQIPITKQIPKQFTPQVAYEQFVQARPPYPDLRTIFGQVTGTPTPAAEATTQTPAGAGLPFPLGPLAVAQAQQAQQGQQAQAQQAQVQQPQAAPPNAPPEPGGTAGTAGAAGAAASSAATSAAPAAQTAGTSTAAPELPIESYGTGGIAGLIPSLEEVISNLPPPPPKENTAFPGIREQMYQNYVGNVMDQYWAERAAILKGIPDLLKAGVTGALEAQRPFKLAPGEKGYFPPIYGQGVGPTLRGIMGAFSPTPGQFPTSTVPTPPTPPTATAGPMAWLPAGPAGVSATGAPATAAAGAVQAPAPNPRPISRNPLVAAAAAQTAPPGVTVASGGVPVKSEQVATRDSGVDQVLRANNFGEMMDQEGWQTLPYSLEQLMTADPRIPQPIKDKALAAAEEAAVSPSQKEQRKAETERAQAGTAEAKQATAASVAEQPKRVAEAAPFTPVGLEAESHLIDMNNFGHIQNMPDPNLAALNAYRVQQGKPPIRKLDGEELRTENFAYNDIGQANHALNIFVEHPEAVGPAAKVGLAVAKMTGLDPAGIVSTINQLIGGEMRGSPRATVDAARELAVIIRYLSSTEGRQQIGGRLTGQLSDAFESAAAGQGEAPGMFFASIRAMRDQGFLGLRRGYRERLDQAPNRGLYGLSDDETSGQWDPRAKRPQLLDQVIHWDQIEKFAAQRNWSKWKAALHFTDLGAKIE